MPQSDNGGHAGLDNPIWHALNGPHRHLAKFAGETCWYPAGIAPFAAVPRAETVPALPATVARNPGEPVYFAGVLPNSLPRGWHVAARSLMLQMIPAVEPPSGDESGVEVLAGEDRPRMLALAQAAFPDFFRERTAELGVYLGIFAGTRLVAMAGERLALDGLREISGVCTHPDFVGRGSARRLTLALLRRHRERRVQSFLHVGEGNAAARRLYESLGFVVRASLPLAKVERSRAR